MSDATIKEKYLKDKEEVLRQLHVRVTNEVLDRMSSLYPNEIAIDNYTRKLILDHFEKLE